MADESVYDDELDFESATFNPHKALYALHVVTPYSKARVFKSLSEYETYLANKRKEKDSAWKNASSSQHISTGTRTGTDVMPGTSRSDNYATCNIPENAIEKSDVDQGVKKTSRHETTVFTRIEDFLHVGPMSLLKKCMKENLRAKVVVRNAHSMRGHCQGYVVAFDSHFNLAMRDVDEEYVNPLWISKSARRRFKKKAEESSWDSDEQTSGVDSQPTRRTDVDEESKSDDQRCLHDRNPSTKESHRGVIFAHGSNSGLRDKMLKHCNQEEKVRKWEFIPQRKTLHRHVNQLFIKGDMIIAISVNGR